MQKTLFARIKGASLALGAAAALLFLTGCDNVGITNLTPAALAENPSQIYTISTRVKPRSINVVPSSVKVRIIIDGQSFDMRKSDLGSDIYEFDYQLPAGRNELAYYFLVNYDYENQGIVRPREAFSDVIRSSIVGRYVLSLETNRGPVGARVSVLGRGFKPEDTVTFDGAPARTVYDSPNALSFFVPALETGRNYKVEISGAHGVSAVGTFRVDAATVSVSPAELTLAQGKSQPLTFTLASPAPTGGLLLDVTTDVPDSVIMPEVVVEAGSTSATVTVTGGKPGAGSLFLKGFGSGEITVPVTVR